MDRVMLHGQAQSYVEDPTDADYAAAARAALREKDLRLAIEQTSAALALNPLHEPHLRLLDNVLATARTPLLLVEIPAQGAFFGLCAARARALARLDRIDQAIDTLFQAAAFRPSTPFVPWARAWVKTAKNARRVRPETLADALVAFTDAARGLPLDEGVQTNLEAALAVAESVEAQHTPRANLRIACSRALRLLDRSDEALTQLEFFGDPPPWEIAVERAAVHDERGERQERIAWLKRAQRARPGEASTCVDLGNAHLEDGALDKAIAAYERALALDASLDWAVVSAAYARVLAAGASPGPAFSANGRGGTTRTRARALEADLAAYTTRLPDPTDPIVGVIRSVRAQAARAAPPAQLRFRVRTDRSLAPSASVAFAFALAGRQGALRVEHALGTRQVGPLWKADREAEPASPRPPDEVLDRVLDIARTPFAWDAWCAQAAALSAALATDHGAHLVNVMAHPPPPPSEDIDAARWVHGFQLAAALLLALSPKPAAVRWEYLEPLLAGVDDWSAAAALLGLRALARTEPELRSPLIERLLALLPADTTPLAPLSRALAVTGCELASGGARRDFLRLRARVRSEIGEQQADAERLEGSL